MAEQHFPPTFPSECPKCGEQTCVCDLVAWLKDRYKSAAIGYHPVDRPNVLLEAAEMLDRQAAMLDLCYNSNSAELTPEDIMVEIIKIADYWRVMVNRVLVSTHRTKSEALAASKEWRK